MRFPIKSVGPKNRPFLIFCLLLVIYVSLHFATTTVRPIVTELGHPIPARIYSSEVQLIAFYPVYLAERWIRNWSFESSQEFYCDFESRPYHYWLIGALMDEAMWYDELHVPAVSLVILAVLTVAAWRFVRIPIWAAFTLGIACTLLIVIACCSYDEVQNLTYEVEVTPKHFTGSVLWLTVKETAKTNELRAYRSPLHSGQLRAAELITVSANGFTLGFEDHRTNGENLVYLIDFPYDVITKTNWRQYQVEGFFPWHHSDTWTNMSANPIYLQRPH